MSIDTDKIHRLKGKGFDALYEEKQVKWKEIVEEARDYARKCVNASEPVRVGDVVSVVQNAIRIDPEFENHVKLKKLTQKFWVAWYAEYIVDRVYPQADLMNT